MRWNDNKIIKSDEESLLGLNLETYDLLTSADFYACVKSLVGLFTDEYLDTLSIQIVQQLVSADLSSEQSIAVSMPLAKLVPILNISNSIFERNSMKNKLLNDVNLNLFCANVYEAFSVPKKSFMLFEDMADNSSCQNSMVNQVV